MVPARLKQNRVGHQRRTLSTVSYISSSRIKPAWSRESSGKGPLSRNTDNELLKHWSTSKCFRVTQAIFSLICFAVFMAQVYSVFKLYLQYPTRMEVFNHFDNRMVGPAITVSNFNDMRKNILCKSRPELCDKYKGMFLWDAVKPFVMTSNFDTIIKTGHQFAGLVTHCEAKKNCTKDLTVFLSYRFGNCFVLNSNVSGNLNEPLIAYDFNKLYEIHIDFEPKEYMTWIRNLEARVAVHDMYDLPLMSYQSVVIEQGYMYNVQVTKLTTNLLPTPYRTSCYNYRKAAKKLRRKSLTDPPLSRSVCLYDCYKKLSLKFMNCINIINSKYLINEDDFNHKCMEKNNKHDENIENQCETSCKLECRSVSFQYQVLKAQLSYLTELAEWNISRETAKKEGKIQSFVVVEFKTFSHVINTVLPQLQGVEVFGYLGGYLGIFLGLSLVSVPKYILKLLVKIKRHSVMNKNVKTSSSTQETNW